MLSVDTLIGIISLCMTCYSLGYSHGKRDSEIKNNRPQKLTSEIWSDYFPKYYQANHLSVASFSIIRIASPILFVKYFIL